MYIRKKPDLSATGSVAILISAESTGTGTSTTVNVGVVVRVGEAEINGVSSRGNSASQQY